MSAAKRQRTPESVEEALMDPALLCLGTRCSFSHLVLEQVRGQVPAASVADVFVRIAAWLEARNRRHTVRHVHAVVQEEAGVPLAYVFARPHRQWPGAVVVDQCASSIVHGLRGKGVEPPVVARRPPTADAHAFLARFSRNQASF